jgi:hypothetical protein
LPASNSVMIATDVIGLVMEAIAKIAFAGIGVSWAAPNLPAAPS